MESGDPFRLIDVLSSHDVPFVIIGGHAVTYHGYVRATEDTDIVFERSSAAEAALLDALQEVQACWISNEIDPDTGIERTVPVTPGYLRSNRLMMLATDCGFLDVFDYIPGCPNEAVEQLFETAVEADGRQFASLEWLKRMKRAAGRPKDVLDLENLPNE